MNPVALASMTSGINEGENDEVTPWRLPIHDNKPMCRTANKFDESLKKSIDAIDKLDDDTAKLEKISTYLVEMMKDEGGGDDDIWMSKEDQNAFQPLIKK